MRTKAVKEPQPLFGEANRYYLNAKAILTDIPVEYGLYTDAKPVQKAAGLCYLAVLKVLDGHFLKRGLSEEKLPTSTDGYRTLLSKHAATNGRLRAAFESVHHLLHVRAYYRGMINVDVIKIAFQNACVVIEALTGEKAR